MVASQGQMIESGNSWTFVLIAIVVAHSGHL